MVAAVPNSVWGEDGIFFRASINNFLALDDKKYKNFGRKRLKPFYAFIPWSNTASCREKVQNQFYFSTTTPLSLSEWSRRWELPGRKKQACMIMCKRIFTTGGRERGGLFSLSFYISFAWLIIIPCLRSAAFNGVRIKVTEGGLKPSCRCPWH